MCLIILNSVMNFINYLTVYYFNEIQINLKGVIQTYFFNNNFLSFYLNSSQVTSNAILVSGNINQIKDRKSGRNDASMSI